MDTKERDEALAEKARWIQGILTEWARNTGILRAGECIVFSMRIEQVPLVTSEEEPDRVLEMSVGQFFTRKRFTDLGAKGGMSTRIVNAIFLIFEDDGKNVRMGEFFKQYPTPRRLLRILNLGKGGAKFVTAAIRSAGFPFDD